MRPLAALLVALLARAAVAEDASGELDLFALDAQLSRETTVASRRARTLRETPGVVTVLERQDLLASGARDLSEVLMRVPGFQLGVDVEGAVGAGFRGNWGHEGKVLFLVDGVEMNDLMYAGFPLANHLLVDTLERIEIIRGPGSATYGGHAELAVVNVVTRAGTHEGLAASLSAGVGTREPSAATASLSGGGAFGELWVGAAGYAGVSRLGQRTFTDFSGGSFDMASDASAAPAQLSAMAAWNGATLRVLYDDYRTRMRDGYDAVAAHPFEVRWRTLAADARWELRQGERLTVTPELVYRREVPWQVTDPSEATYYYDRTAERLTARVVASWDPTSRVNVVAGAEGWIERARVNDPSLGATFADGATSVSHRNVAAFVEAGADTPLANVLAGVRFERHDAAGDAIVPRLAATRLFAPFHVKLLGSGAFRAPSIENLEYGPGVRPERTWVLEGELGCQVASWLYASANAFDVTIERPIVFGYDAVADSDAYRNEARTGTRGVEAEVRAEHRLGSASVTWSFYDARGKNRVATYAVPDRPDLLVGFAGHKIVAAAQLRVRRDVVVSPAVVFLSDRYAYDRADGAGVPVIDRLGARASVDLFATWRDAGARGVELGLGVRDLLDAGTLYPQPYDGGHAPLPVGGREVWARLRYER